MYVTVMCYSESQFRWIVYGLSGSWSLDDVYIGEGCPDLCNGHGDCKDAVCHCDEGFTGNKYYFHLLILFENIRNRFWRYALH